MLADVEEPAPRLNAQQRRLFDEVVHHRSSVYYGGDAGTGKTHVATAMIDSLRNSLGLVVVVCAPTGQAAQLLDGFTVHQLFGILPPSTEGGVGGNTLRPQWRMREDLAEASVLVIDEVSMLSKTLFQQMDQQARRARNAHHRLFGGLQVVALGDFLQLAPIGRVGTDDARYCFESPLFAQLFGTRMYRLTEQMRQGDDRAFAESLALLRRGECTDRVVEMLSTRLYTRAMAPAPSQVVHLYCLRREADAQNNAALAALPSTECRWRAIDWVESEECRRVFNGCALEEEICLKTGAPVLLRRNLDLRRRLVNGTRGVVISVNTLCELGLHRCGTCAVCTSGRPPPLAAHHYPLLGELPPPSWNRSLPVVDFGAGIGTHVVGLATIEYKHPRAAAKRGRKRPSGGDDAPTPDSGLMARRRQLPLTLAFALTVHKAQGMTLREAVISWNRAFTNGQLYVALSRCPRLAAVFILSHTVPRDRFTADALALAFETQRLVSLANAPATPAVASSSAAAAAAAPPHSRALVK